jgi:hypothetical protein
MAAAWLNDEGYSEGDMRADSRVGEASAATSTEMPSSLLPEWLKNMSESQRSGEWLQRL